MFPAFQVYIHVGAGSLLVSGLTTFPIPHSRFPIPHSPLSIIHYPFYMIIIITITSNVTIGIAIVK
ncbi:hypothetical protein [Moorena producens]|uniref:hypothetical protein n=1 Tax=Moorena producens TaxID=1155739 RepID=UPI00131443CB|nr:hypothetical protein [Moorena producens]